MAEIDQERLSTEDSVVTAFQAGELTRNQFGEAIDAAQHDAAIKKQEARTTLGVEFSGASVGAAQALSEWYRTYDLAEIPGTGVIDWQRRDELEAQLFHLIDAGEFGNPAMARRMIDERRRAEHTNPIVQQYFANKDFVGQTGYYDATDNEYAQFANVVRNVDPSIGSYSDLVKAINRAELDGDAQRVAILNRIQNRIESRVSAVRKRMRILNPDLDRALLELGRVSVPARRAS